jgi:hypothetical protein
MDEHSNIALKIMVDANDCSPNIDIFVREKCVSVYNRIMNSLPARRWRERSARTMQNDVPSCLEAQCHQGERNGISTGDHKFGPRRTHPLKGEGHRDEVLAAVEKRHPRPVYEVKLTALSASLRGGLRPAASSAGGFQ